MTVLKRLAALNWRLVFAALIAVGILHICATFAASEWNSASAFQRLAPTLPANEMQILPPLDPTNQPLPFLTPDARYAVCRVDTSKGLVNVKVLLPDRGWTVALYSADGDNLYAVAGQQGRVTELVFELAPTDERFVGLTPEARGRPQPKTAALSLALHTGLVVVRAPERGAAYRPLIEAELREATCAPLAATQPG